MISSTCHVASQLAITGILSVYFFREAVVRPALSGGDRKVSAGRVVVSTCMSTVMLIMAAHRTAAKLLSGEIGKPSTSENPTNTVPTAPDFPAYIRYQDATSLRPLEKSALLGPFQRPFLSCQPTLSSPVRDSPPCDITITDFLTSLSPVPESASDITINLSISSKPVPESKTPCDITTIDLLIPSSPVFPSTPSDITTIIFSTSSTHIFPSTPSDINIIDLSTSSTHVFPSTPSDINIIDLSTSSTHVFPSTPSDINIIDLSTSSTHVFPSTTNDITTIKFPDLANCNRLSLTSDTTLVARDDNDNDLKDVFVDVSNTKEAKSSGDERTFHGAKERASARAAHGYRVDILPPSTTLTNPRPLFLVNKFRTTPSHTITNHSLPGSVHLMDALHQTTKTANSLHSSPSLAPKDDFINLEDVFMDEALDIKDLKSSGDERTHKDNSAVTTNPINNSINNAPSLLPYPWPLAPVDKFQTTTSTITKPSLPGSAHLTDADTSLTGTLRPANTNSSLTGSAHPANADASLTGPAHLTNVITHTTKTAASWLKPLILVTKHASGRLIPPPTALQSQPEKSCPHKLKQQKRKPRASRSNAACDSIVRSRHRRHANRIVGHLTQVCEQIHTDQAALMNVWVAIMAEIGLTSILAGNHQTLLGLPFPPMVDAVLVPEPGSRIKARLASLRQRTNAIADTIPATVAAATTTSSLPWRHTS